MAGNNVDTKLLLHMNGADESITFIDSRATGTPHTVTAVGNAQIDTAQSVFGGASGLFDGAGDYLSMPDSPDWDVFASSIDDWTLDAHIRRIGDGGNTSEPIFSQANTTASMYWRFEHHRSRGLRIVVYDSGQIIVTADLTPLSNDTWYHIAMCKVGSLYGIYIDGTQVSFVDDSSTLSIAGLFAIGTRPQSSPVAFFNGNIDEARVQKSNYFTASPNVGLSDTIVVPTEEYSLAGFPHSQGYIVS
jgi:hypothetical protein